MIEGQRWLPVARAAALAGTSAATIKRWMGDGTLDWLQLRPGSSTLLASEADILRLRAARSIVHKETAKRATAATKNAAQDRRSQRDIAPAAEGRAGTGVFVRTWDPAPQPLPISGRDKPDANRP